KPFLKYALVYDVQENYHQNVLLNNSSPTGLKLALATGIKAIEKAAHPFIDHYFFAERSYPAEFDYIQRFTILENKYNRQGKQPVQEALAINRNNARFLLTGTLTAVYGTAQGIDWFLKLQERYPDTRLKISGHAPQVRFRKYLETQYGNHANIILALSEYPLPYVRIQQDILDADILLMPYETIDSISSKIPTKLFEGIALNKPILISCNPIWERILKIYPAGLSIDFSQHSRAKDHFEDL